ncbi:DUF6325 family protein [Nocardia sp. FBN12]|uniref:DUF6325 family protein n=1 Tax=Nocardia sp. FBN12 TaxID=3419766 RepID=UPI003D0380BD
MSDTDHFGPIDYIVVEFPDGRIDPNGFAVLLDLVDRGAFRILDLEFVDATGALLPIENLGPDLVPFVGATSGLLDRSDFAEIAAELSPASVAAVLVYEELTMLPVLTAWENSGAKLLTEGQLTLDELDTALTETEGL